MWGASKVNMLIKNYSPPATHFSWPVSCPWHSSLNAKYLELPISRLLLVIWREVDANCGYFDVCRVIVLLTCIPYRSLQVCHRDGEEKETTFKSHLFFLFHRAAIRPHRTVFNVENKFMLKRVISLQQCWRRRRHQTQWFWLCATSQQFYIKRNK